MDIIKLIPVYNLSTISTKLVIVQWLRWMQSMNDLD